MNKYVAAVIVLASLTASAQTTKPATTPAKPASPAKTAPAPAKPAATPKPATTSTAAKPATNHHYKAADDAIMSSCSGWAASYSKVVKHVGKLTITGTCTAPSNIHLYLSSRKSSAAGTRNYALMQWWVVKTKPTTTSGPVSVKRIVMTNTAPTSVMVGKSSITVSNSSPAPTAPAAKPAPAKPAAAKPAPAPAKK